MNDVRRQFARAMVEIARERVERYRLMYSTLARERIVTLRALRRAEDEEKKREAELAEAER